MLSDAPKLFTAIPLPLSVVAAFVWTQIPERKFRVVAAAGWLMKIAARGVVSNVADVGFGVVSVTALPVNVAEERSIPLATVCAPLVAISVPVVFNGA